MLQLLLEFENLSAFKSMLDKNLPTGNWYTITQEMINDFANATLDKQWIHVDEKRAQKESPFQSTVAHGFMSVAMISRLLEEVFAIKSVKMGLNYGLNTVRFPNPVPVNSELRMHATIKEIEELRAGNQSLVDSVNSMRERLDNTTDDTQLRRKLTELREINQRLSDENRELKSRLERITAEYSGLKNKYDALSEKCAGMQTNYKRLTERVEEHNSLQNEWREIIASPNLLSLRRNIISAVGGDFYKRMFETPISLEFSN